MPPLCKGRWLACQDGGVVKVIFFYKTIPHPTPSGAKGQLKEPVRIISVSALYHCTATFSGE